MKELYLIITGIVFCAVNYGLGLYIYHHVKSYLFDEDCEFEVEERHLPLTRHLMGDFGLGYDLDDLGMQFLLSFLVVFFWPAFLIVGLLFFIPYLILRTARFFIRISRGLSKIAKVAHKHEEGEIKKEEVGELKY